MASWRLLSGFGAVVILMICVSLVHSQGQWTTTPLPSAGSQRGAGIVFLANESLVFNHSCVLMETEMVRIWARSNQYKDFILDSDISDATYTVHGDCTYDSTNGSGNADLRVRFVSNFGNTSVSSASFHMIFSSDVYNWYLTNLTMSVSYSGLNGSATENDIVLSTEELYASADASYYCNEPTITNFISPLPASGEEIQYGLMFGQVIFQPFLNSTGDTFSPVEPCEYAFTIGLWMAVITGLIMGLILFFGITMLASIRTMDRFDDPKTSKLLSVPNE